MKIDQLLRLADYAAKDPSLIPNHSPDVPNGLQKELAECVEILGLVEDDPEFIEKLKQEIKSLRSAIMVYTACPSPL